MILNEAKVETKGNLVFDEDVAMTFDTGASAFLLNNLIKTYSSPYTAVLREYTSNALDSHVRAGQKRPVEVTLPSDLSPALVIEDFGLGLDRDGLKGYGQFGKSDKRDSNDYVGGFGLGSKSGLAVASSFTVSSVKDGKRNTVIVGRRDDGHPTMGFLPEQDTTDANGVKITIPTNERFKLETAVQQNFFLGWEPGTILINGEEPHLSVYSDKFTDMDGLGWRSSAAIRDEVNSNRRGVVAMVGPVKYSLDLAQMENLDQSLVSGFLSEIVVKLDNGSVEIAPSRENLIYDKRTRAYISERITKLVKVGSEHYQTDVNEANTMREALQLRDRALTLGFNKVDYTYKGKSLQYVKPVDALAEAMFTIATLSHGSRVAPWQASRDTLNYERLLNWHFPRLYATQQHSILVVEAGPLGDVRGRTMHVEANGAVMWAENNSKTSLVPVDHYRIYFTNLKVGKIDPVVRGAFSAIVKASDYMAVVTAARQEANKKAREESKARIAAYPKPTEPEYRILRQGTYGNGTWFTAKQSELDPSKKYILLKNGEDSFGDKVRATLMTQKGWNENRNLDALIASLGARGYKFILANKNTNTKEYFKVIPGLTTDVKKALEDEVRSISHTYTEMQKRAIQDKNDGTQSWAQTFPVKRIPEIKDAKVREWLTNMTDAVAKDEEFLNTYSRWGERHGLDVSLAKMKTKIDVSPGKQFPLMNRITGISGVWDSAIEYMNLLLTANRRAEK